VALQPHDALYVVDLPKPQYRCQSLNTSVYKPSNKGFASAELPIEVQGVVQQRALNDMDCSGPGVCCHRVVWADFPCQTCEGAREGGEEEGVKSSELSQVIKCLAIW